MSEMLVLKIVRRCDPWYEVVEEVKNPYGTAKEYVSVCAFNNVEDANSFVLKQRVSSGEVETAVDAHVGREER